jgi:hypothetical protein
MIKVFVVVTGLALAQLNESDGISIDFPKTANFLVPGGPDLQQAEAAWTEQHEMSAVVITKNGEVPLTNELTVTLASQANDIDFNDAQYFPDFTVLHGGTIGGNRQNCLDTKPLDACRALSKPDEEGVRQREPLLAGRVQIAGIWELRAKYYDEGKKEYKNDESTWPVVRFRTPALDPSNSLIHPFAGGRLANTMVFAGDIQDTETVTINGDQYGQSHVLPASKCKEYEESDDGNVPCIIVQIMNHKPACGPDGCTLPPWAKDNADTHFLQLYRLLDKYNAKKDELNLRPMMPYPDSIAEANPGSGASSPRCYPAVKT